MISCIRMNLITVSKNIFNKYINIQQFFLTIQNLGLFIIPKSQDWRLGSGSNYLVFTHSPGTMKLPLITFFRHFGSPKKFLIPNPQYSWRSHTSSPKFQLGARPGFRSIQDNSLEYGKEERQGPLWGKCHIFVPQYTVEDSSPGCTFLLSTTHIMPEGGGL